MKIKLVAAIAIWIQLFCISIAWAESENLDELNNPTGSGTMICPVDGSWQLTSPQGWRIHPIDGIRKYHAGADLGTDMGTPIVACQSGTVKYSGWLDGYGNTVIMDHGNSVTSLYGHNSQLLVNTGQSVKQGERIALAGSTGNSTGPHCHWEVRINDHPVDPGLFCPVVEQAELSYDPNHVPESIEGIDNIDGKAAFEVSVDFAKPLRELSNQFVDVVTAAMNLIKDSVYKIFMALLTMDIVIGLAWRSFGSEGNDDFANWVIYRVVMYGIMMFLLANWGTIIGGLAMHGFPALGSMAAGSTPDETAKILSDPTSIIQKGMYIIEPIINESLKIKGLLDFVMHAVTQALCLIFGLVFLVLFLVIGLQIMKAYLEFYFVILFSFTGFVFSGIKYTRKYGSNCINAVFAVSINLMFFCMFSFLLNYTMENITVGSFLETRIVEAGTSKNDSLPPGMIVSDGITAGADISGKPKAEVAYRTQQILKEKYVKELRADFIWAQMAHESGANFDSYIALNYHNYAGMGYDGYDYTHYASDEEFAQDYAKTLNAYAEDGLFEANTPEEYAQALKHGGYFSAPIEEYAQDMRRLLNGGSVTQTLLNLLLLMKLLLVLLVFVFFADRISRCIMKQFGSPGFHLTNE